MKKINNAQLDEVAHCWLVLASGMLFLVVGEAKWINVFGDTEILKLPNSVLRLSKWFLIATAGMVEVGIGLLSVWAKDGLFWAHSLLLLSGELILYRAMDWHL